MQTIETTFYGPTNIKGSRIKAITASGHHYCWHEYDHAMNGEENHIEAARKLARRVEWTGHMVTGSTRRGYVHVFSDGGSTHWII